MFGSVFAWGLNFAVAPFAGILKNVTPAKREGVLYNDIQQLLFEPDQIEFPNGYHLPMSLSLTITVL
jgi:hypothetical protein